MGNGKHSIYMALQRPKKLASSIIELPLAFPNNAVRLGEIRNHVDMKEAERDSLIVVQLLCYTASICP